MTASAILNWGVGGTQFSAEIDWVQGTIFALPASFLNVGLRVFAPAPEFNETELVTFGASIAYGYATSSSVGSTARRTIRLGELAPSASIDTIIPRWANAFSIIGAQAAGIAPNLNLFLRTQTGPVDNIAQYAYNDRSNQAQQYASTFPIPNGARYLEITNLDDTNGWGSIGVLYHMAFG